MTGHRRIRHIRAFSLVEPVMVVTIIGIIAAIAVPRISTAATKASGYALEATVGTVRRAIDHYYAEHGRFPGYDPATEAPDGLYFVRQLLEYSDVRGATSSSLSVTYLYGPYLRAPFPQSPVNELATVYVKASPSDPDPAADSYGWVAVLSTGDFGILASDTELDDAGVKDSDRKSTVRLQG